MLIFFDSEETGNPSYSSYLHLLSYSVSLHAQFLDTFGFHVFIYSLNHHLGVIHDSCFLCGER